MSLLAETYARGVRAARMKFALAPPTEVDQFMAEVEQGKDVPPEPALPPMPGAPSADLPALDGTTALQLPSTSPPTPPGLGSTVGTPPEPPPSMGALGG